MTRSGSGRTGARDIEVQHLINLSAEKRRVFADAARVLRPGGRLALADIVTEGQIGPPASSCSWSRATLATASRASGRSARARSTAPGACRCSRSNVHPATPRTRIWVVGPMSRKRDVLQVEVCLAGPSDAGSPELGRRE